MKDVVNIPWFAFPFLHLCRLILGRLPLWPFGFGCLFYRLTTADSA